ncbi:MAG: biotin transporter BioY [Desulfovibrionaceae bacterium]|nr:biotin transporter BioY [Desulfovibrionaceae bacterium]
MSQPFMLRRIHRLVWTSLLAALVAVGAFVALPIGPVPVTLQTLFVLLAGLTLGARNGTLAVTLYLAAGSLGLPVFAGGKAGLAVLLGPTGGFLLGFIPSAMFCGLARGLGVKKYLPALLICVGGTAVTLLAGTVQLMLVLHISLEKALAVGVLPFLPGGAAKCLAAAAVYQFLVKQKLLPL